MVDGVVGKRRVSHAVGSTEKHLERNVGYKLPHLPEPLPRILVEEAHGHIEGSSTPALKSPGIGIGVAGLLGNGEQIGGPHTGSEERLMGVTPGRVHDKTSLVGADGLGEAFGAIVEDNVPPALRAGCRCVDSFPLEIVELGDLDLAPEFGLTNLALDLATVDGKLSEISEELLGSVLGANEVEEGGRVIDKGGPALAFHEGVVCEELEQEGDVGLHATDTELDQRAEHLSAYDLICGSTARALDQHAVVVGCDDGTCKSISTVQTDLGNKVSKGHPQGCQSA